MAYVNVKEWSPDQVTEWLRGLDNVVLPYINSFLNNEVKGHQLLSLRSDDLEHLGVYTLGHQEVILEGVEHLRNFHYELDRENLQLLALRLSCASHSLYNELVSKSDKSKVETQTMSDVANIITIIKPLFCWLDRSPFSGQMEYTIRKERLLQLSLEMATCAQRDRFAEKPVAEIRSVCDDLGNLADNIIQEICDPMLLQPASLDLATLKKKENELGFSLMPSFHGIHQITDIKYASPAHASNKLEEGDEIVQVNYQTVVGWQRKKVLLLFQESPPDIVLTVKKRPRHTKVYGQIYMKPYRLPSKKRATPYSRWNDNLQSPRPELLTIPDIEMPLPKLAPIKLEEPVLESGDSSSDSEPLESPHEGRVYPLKPRPVLQRRNTITGASPTSKRPQQNIEQYWNELKHQAAYKHSSSTYIETDNSLKRDSVYLRDKSASCGYGLELSQRPVTYPKQFKNQFLSKKDKKVNFKDDKISEIPTPQDIKISTILKESNFVNTCNINVEGAPLEKSVSVNSLLVEENIKYIDDTVDEMFDRSNMINPEWKNEIIEELIGSLKKNISGENNLPNNSPDKNCEKSIEMPPSMKNEAGASSKPDEKPPIAPRIEKQKPEIKSKKPAVPPRNFKIRGKLDKSHSTPAYDTTQDDTPQQPPPEILITEADLDIYHPYTQIEYHDLEAPSVEINATPESEENRPPVIEIKPEPPPRKFEPKMVSTPISKSAFDFDTSKGEKVSPGSRLLPNKNKTKKRNALAAKRRKVSVKDLSPFEMSGFLYQRLRNKHTQSSNWEKRFFVLTGSSLYGYKNKDGPKADCLIFLSGFTVATANEVRSRSNAFRVYHTGTAFYFSAENNESMNMWIEFITAATHLTEGKNDTLYSESDQSDSEKKPDAKEKLETSKLSFKRLTTRKNSSESISGSLDRKYLRFFGSNKSKNLPVPTPQFRSYRKVVPPTLVVNQSTPLPKNVIPKEIPKLPETQDYQNSKLKPKPINYMHASNPSLHNDLNDYQIHNFYHRTRQINHRGNLSGFVTLEQFMLRSQEEEMRQNGIQAEEINLNSIQPDVVYGQISPAINDARLIKKQSKHSRTNSDVQRKTIEEEEVRGSKTLPKNPDRRNSDSIFKNPKVVEQEPLYADKKSIKKTKDRSYELIYCPQKVNDVQFAQNRTLDERKKDPSSKTKLQRQHSLNSSDKKFNRGESPEKFWLDSLRRSDKVSDKSSTKVRLKSATQYTPMSLPLTPDSKGKLNPKFAFELNLDEKSGNKSGLLKSFFGNKSEEKKEKTLLGSPRLHRAFFGKNQGESGESWTETNVLPFSNLLPPSKVPQPQNPSQNLTNNLNSFSSNTSSNTSTLSNSSSSSNFLQNSPDYPGLEYPPVFEPETYSLANPSCNLTLLRKHK